MGLLSRASNLDENSELAFTDFILKYQFKTCAILEIKGLYYIPQNSIGFDSKTLKTIVSTPAYWDGLCPDSNKLFHFQRKDDSLSPLLQLFSERMKEGLNDLWICKTEDSKIFISFQQFSQNILKDLTSINDNYHNCNIDKLNPLIKENSSILKFKIDLSKIIKDYKENEKLIFNEYYNRLTCFYNNPDATRPSSDHIINTVFIADRNYSTLLIEKHLKLNFSEIMDTYSDKIDINFLGTVNSCNEILEFLQFE